jgi:hypothetical protein
VRALASGLCEDKRRRGSTATGLGYRRACGGEAPGDETTTTTRARSCSFCYSIHSACTGTDENEACSILSSACIACIPLCHMVWYPTTPPAFCLDLEGLFIPCTAALHCTIFVVDQTQTGTGRILQHLSDLAWISCCPQLYINRQHMNYPD